MSSKLTKDDLEKLRKLMKSNIIKLSTDLFEERMQLKKLKKIINKTETALFGCVKNDLELKELLKEDLVEKISEIKSKEISL